MSIRDEITKQFNIDEHGIVRTPGKFEGEMLYTPFFYDSGLNGCASEDINGVWFFEILADERAAFPELGSAFGIAVEESEQGFIYTNLYETREEYASAIQRLSNEDDEVSQ